VREERRLRVFEDMVLRRIFGPKRDEVTGEWRKLHNEELNDLYFLPNIVRVVKSRMRWTRHVARMGEDRGVHRVLVGKPEGKRPLGDPDVVGSIILRWIFTTDRLHPYIHRLHLKGEGGEREQQEISIKLLL
jgi:hypothetical protein